MPYPSLLHPEPLPLWQSTADLYLHRRHSDTVLAQSLWVGHVFCALPGLSSSCNQVLGERIVPGEPCVLITYLVLAARFLWCTMRAPFQVCRRSPLES